MSKRASTPPTQPNTTRSRTTILETVERPDLDGQDERLDKELIDSDYFPADSRMDIRDLLVLVLEQIGHVNAPLVAKKTVGGHDNLETSDKVAQVIWDSVAEKKFYTLRRLAILQPKCTPNAKRRAVEEAWKVDYVGSAHQLLFNNIKIIFSQSEVYKREVSIIQSSGSGKSRTVHELSKLAFTIPLNVRPDAESKQNAYPDPDSVVNQLFDGQSKEENMRITVFLFFKHLFQHITDVLNNTNKAECSRPELAAWWSKYLERGRRQVMYKEASDKTYLAKRDLNLTSENCSETAVAALTLLCEKLESVAPLDEAAEEPAIIFYVDEAHTLMTGSYGPNWSCPRNRLDLFRACAAAFQDRIFFIFISTDPKVAGFSPKIGPSARGRKGPQVPAPITETLFDCYFQTPDRIIAPGSLRHEDVSDYMFLAKFGRPLLWTMLQDNPIGMYAGMVDLAMIKLVASYDARTPFVGKTGKLAVLDVVLSIGYERAEEAARTLEAEMVKRHMRTAFSIPEHRQYVSSGYPSEPFLAEAASGILWRWRMELYDGRAANPDIVLTTLIENLDKNILDRRELLGLVGRELLVHAYQKSVKHMPTGYLHFCNGCLVTDFIGNLFAAEYAELVLDSVPDNVQPTGITFREAFKNARVRFTHFSRVTDQSGITTNAMCAAYVRGMALIFPTNHRTLGCAIPILLWDAFLCEHVMSGLLVRFKPRAMTEEWDGTQEAVEFFGSGEDEVCEHEKNANLAAEVDFGLRPYVTLTMDLRFKPRPAEESNTSSHMPPASSSKTTIKNPAPSKSQRHPRYQISASGCSPTIYSVIEPTQTDLYASLLQSHDLIEEHARQDAESLSGVRRLKPFFSQGPDSYDWVGDPVLNAPADVEGEGGEERVEVGGCMEGGEMEL